MKVEDVGQHRQFLRRWTRQIHPDLGAAGRVEPGRIHAVDRVGAAITMHEDGNHIDDRSREVPTGCGGLVEVGGFQPLVTPRNLSQPLAAPFSLLP